MRLPCYSQLAQYHNAICFGGFLHKNNISYLLLGLYHSSVNRISIVLMQITPQDERYYGMGFVQVVNWQ